MITVCSLLFLTGLGLLLAAAWLINRLVGVAVLGLLCMVYSVMLYADQQQKGKRP